MMRNCQFTSETKNLIADLERKCSKEEKNKKEITKEQLDFINILIQRYEEAFPECYDKSLYQEICIYGQYYLIRPEMVREIKEVVKAVNKNSFDNRGVYRRYELNGEVKRKKSYKPYRIQRLARMLKIAKEANYALFESFIKIPDVYYTLNVIKSNRFGELDKYMGVKSG